MADAPSIETNGYSISLPAVRVPEALFGAKTTLPVQFKTVRWSCNTGPQKSSKADWGCTERYLHLGRTIEPVEIVGLPLVNRNVYSELSLTPGVMANNMSATANPSGSPGFTTGLPSADVQINGSIDGGNPEVAFYLDGGNNITGMRNYGNPAPNPDALEEFRVETSAFGAQYGQFSAAVITVITKSGTNKFHGSLFEFNRNTDFNAYPWGSTIKNPYHRNQFGGNFGGPVKHDKAFFFFSYAGLRQVAGAALTGAVVPTANERLGDFTADTFKVNMPGTKTQVDGTNSSPNCVTATLNCIPSGLLDPTT